MITPNIERALVLLKIKAKLSTCLSYTWTTTKIYPQTFTSPVTMNLLTSVTAQGSHLVSFNLTKL